MLFLLFVSKIYCDVEVLCQWKNVVYDESPDFPKENAAITGIKYYDNKIYITVPRWKESVPYTLNVVGKNDLNESVLFPWPDAEIQDYINGGCDKIQYVQSMEIDLVGRMWVIDVGRRNTLTDNPINLCPPKLLIISMSTGKILHHYTFPESVADYNKTFLNDIAVDVIDEIAYISDAGVGGIIVYDLKRNWSRKYVGKSAKNEPNVSFTILDVDYGTDTFTTPADGITLSPERDKVIFCALQGLSLYSIPTKCLLDSTISDEDLEEYVEKIGEKPAPSDGLAMTESGVLYFGGLTTNAIYKATFPYNLENETILVAEDSDKLVWVDTFAFDNKGALLATVNYLNLFKEDPYNTTRTYYVVSVDVGERSYMHGQHAPSDGDVPGKDRKAMIAIIASVVGGVVVLAFIVGVVVVICVRKSRSKAGYNNIGK